MTLSFVNHNSNEMFTLLKDSCEENKCHSNATCEIIDNKEHCFCPAGMYGVSQNCEDIDECLTINDCKDKSICINKHASFECHCETGFYSDNPRRYNCTYINECEIKDTCPSVSECVDTTGSYKCECHLGYDHSTVDNVQYCTNINECDLIKTASRRAVRVEYDQVCSKLHRQ